MRFSARVLGFLFAFLLLIFVSKTSFAQTASYIPQNTNQNVPNNLNIYSQNVLFSVISVIGCQIAGIDPVTKSQTCLGFDQKTGKIGYVNSNGGAIGVMGNMIGVLYTPPIHTADYFQYLAGNFGITKGAYAQGVGLTSINPISGLWVTFRNIVYLLFVLVFVLIGLGIMLRVRIDPRTVMTIQNQIPKIIIGLILVTFSFAIAGFLIDLMWVAMIVIINILTTAHPQILGALKTSTYVTPFGLSDVVGGFFGVALGTAGAIGGGIYNTFNANTVSGLVTLPIAPECSFTDIGCHIGELIASTIGAFVNQVLGILVGFIVGFFVFFVVIIAVIVALFKLWFALIKAYISILIDIIFAPFWIVGGMLPGAGPGIGFGAWIRDLTANLMAFPVVIGLFLIGKVIADGSITAGPAFFTPPLVGNPLSSGSGFGALIAFGIIMMSPNVVEMVKKAFKASGGFGLGGTAVGVAAVGAVGGAVGNRLYGKNPLTGKREGPLVNVGQRATRAVAGTWVGRGAGRVTSPVRNSRAANWFRSKETIEARQKAKEKAAEDNATLSADEVSKKIGGS